MVTSAPSELRDSQTTITPALRAVATRSLLTDFAFALPLHAEPGLRLSPLLPGATSDQMTMREIFHCGEMPRGNIEAHTKTYTNRDQIGYTSIDQWPSARLPKTTLRKGSAVRNP